MNDLPLFATTVVGSFPDLDSEALCRRLVSQLDIPVWPQLPRRSFRESMYVQYGHNLPAAVVDSGKERLTFQVDDKLSDALEQFYEQFLSENLDYFALSPDFASGFFEMLAILQKSEGLWVKGQVTGPISFGLTVTDQDLRASLYNEMLAEAIVKNTACNARWQIKQLGAHREKVLMFVDEPYMAAFGSAFVSLERGQVIAMLDEVFAAIHRENGVAGVHCCANTDWSVLLSTAVDVLNLDAYGYLENLALYPVELRAFLDRGGRVAWGIVPNNEAILEEKPASLVIRLQDGMALISERAKARGVNIPVDELVESSLLTPSCGLGSALPDVADRVLDMLSETGELLRRG